MVIHPGASAGSALGRAAAGGRAGRRRDQGRSKHRESARKGRAAAPSGWVATGHHEGTGEGGAAGQGAEPVLNLQGGGAGITQLVEGLTLGSRWQRLSKPGARCCRCYGCKWGRGGAGGTVLGMTRVCQACEVCTVSVCMYVTGGR